MTNATIVCRDMEMLHPKCRSVFVALALDLRRAHQKGEVAHLLLPFETYRTPERQAYVLADGKSKAGPWSSPHQYGLAVDFVPQVKGVWTWDVAMATWNHLRLAAHARGLVNELNWDRAHVEHPAFKLVVRDRLL